MECSENGKESKINEEEEGKPVQREEHGSMVRSAGQGKRLSTSILVNWKGENTQTYLLITSSHAHRSSLCYMALPLLSCSFHTPSGHALHLSLTFRHMLSERFGKR